MMKMDRPLMAPNSWSTLGVSHVALCQGLQGQLASFRHQFREDVPDGLLLRRFGGDQQVGSQAVKGDQIQDRLFGHQEPPFQDFIVQDILLVQDAQYGHVLLCCVRAVEIMEGDCVTQSEFPAVDFFYSVISGYENVVAARELPVIHGTVLQVSADFFRLLLCQKQNLVVVVIIVLLWVVVADAEALDFSDFLHALQGGDSGGRLLPQRRLGL